MQSDDVRTLADLGYLALSRGLDEHAMAIFQGVKAARPDQEAGTIGVALVHMLRGELDPAIKLLRGLGPSDAALTFLGIALARQGELDEARRLLTDVVTTAAGTPCAHLAQETLASLARHKP
jgi:Flp pilus assembly protein TadD